LQDRLHQRGGTLPGDAGAGRVEGPDRRAARLVGQALQARRRRAHQKVGRDHRTRGHTGIDAGRASFRQDVLAGLSLPQKALPPKHFYDAAGSRLFERICRLPEYYPTRAELSLTRAHLPAIARFAGRGGVLLEYGSGESLKTRLLIRAMRPSVY